MIKWHIHGTLCHSVENVGKKLMTLASLPAQAHNIPIERQPSVLIQDSVVTNETNITIYNDPEIIMLVELLRLLLNTMVIKNQSQVNFLTKKEVAKSMIPRMSMGDRFCFSRTL